MRGFVVAIVVMLFALLGAQSSAHAQTIVRVNAIAAFDPNVVDDASVNDSSASPREAPQGAGVIDPADDRGAEVRDRGPRGQPMRLPKPRAADYFWCVEHAPAQALLGLDVPPPR